MKYFIGFVLCFQTLCITQVSLGGTNTLSTQSSGTIIRAAHVNAFETAFQNDIVARNSSGVPTDLAGQLGTTSLKWLKAIIASGYWQAGDIKYFEDFSGAVTISEGWFEANGQIINEANYESQPGRTATSWNTFIISSPLDGLQSPDLRNIYLVGSDNSASSGVFVGNALHQVNLEHTHIQTSHNHSITSPGNHGHQWYNFIGSSTTAQTFDANGDAIDIGLNTNPTARQIAIIDSSEAPNAYLGADSFTDDLIFNPSTTNTANTAAVNQNAGSTTQDIQPRSMKARVYIRIID